MASSTTLSATPEKLPSNFHTCALVRLRRLHDLRILHRPSGTRNDLSIYTYNESEKSYNSQAFDRSGTPRATPLTIEGSLWSYLRRRTKGKKIHIKTINDFSKPGLRHLEY